MLGLLFDEFFLTRDKMYYIWVCFNRVIAPLHSFVNAITSKDFIVNMRELEH